MTDVIQHHTWAIDPVHSRLRFEVKYLHLTIISGWFNEFDGILMASEHFHYSQLNLSIYTRSICTGNDVRDAHLRSTDFLDTDRYPTISYHSTSILMEDNTMYISGLLSIKNITKEFSISARYMGKAHDERGNMKAGFTIDEQLNRADFNIMYNKMVIAEEVALRGDIQLLLFE